jgi:hypothetical protein
MKCRLARGLTVALLMGSCAVTASAGGVRVAGPVVRLDPPSLDFGTLAQGEIREVQVAIHNDGTQTLAIQKIESDCGCTVAQAPDSLIAPGGVTQLHVSFQTRTFSGGVVKNIFLTTNDPASPRATLTLKAFVRAQVSIRPASVDFGAVAAGETRRETVTIKAAAADTLRILGLEFPAELMTTTTERTTAGDSVTVTLHLDLRPDAPRGPFRATGVVRTNLKSDKLTVHLTGQVHGFFRVEPGAVSLGQVRQGATKTATITLTGTASGARRVTGATCTAPCLAAEVVEREPGRAYEVRVTLLSGAPAGKVTENLTIETDDPAQPRITLDVRGNVRQARD